VAVENLILQMLTQIKKMKKGEKNNIHSIGVMVIGAFNNIFGVAEENQRSFASYWQFLSH
jgi:hypothetical protein